MLRWMGFGILMVSAVGCAAAPSGPTNAPASELEPVAVAAAPTVAAQVPPVVAVLPEPASECEAGDDGDDRCPNEILHAAAMSYLGKTTAMFDGVTMVEVEIDPELLMDEACHDAGFAQLVLAADTTPADGQLQRHEALALEAAVFAQLDEP